MHNLLYNISQVLGITILHSLWQGLLIFIVLRLFLLIKPATPPVIKYWVSYAALSVTLAWFIATLFKELGHYEWLSTTALQVTPLTLPGIIHEANAPVNKLYFNIAQYMPFLTILYIVGLAFNTLKLGMAWNNIYRIKQSSSNAGFEGLVNRLCQQLTITRLVKVNFSEWVDVPCITGFLKPVILLPVSITCTLSAEEIEAILLHELAHVKRNDYLLNFIQQVIGILLFFNPFARLISKIIHQERENSCDDMVVQAADRPFIYAQALLKLEENKQYQWQLALAATTKKYELLNRIERIMKTKTQTVNIRPVLITVLALTCAISSIAWLNPEIKGGKIVIKNAPAIHKIALALSAPAPAVTEPAKLARKHRRNISLKFISDTTMASPVNDTTIKNRKYKIVVEDENGHKTEYDSLNELSEKDRHALLSNSSRFSYTGTDSNASAHLQQLYQSDAWKKQVEEAQKMGMEMSKKMNTPKFKKLQKQMVAKSLAMANTPEFKKMQKELVERYTKSVSSPEVQKMIQDITKHASNPDYYNSPEFQKQMESFSKYYDSPEFKEITKKMSDYYDNPDFKKQMKKMTDYYDSPEFKSQLEKMSKGFDDVINQHSNNANKQDANGDDNDHHTDKADTATSQQKQ